MNLETQILSEVTTHLKYSKYVPEKNRRETWDELVTRNKNMHIKKFPQLTDEIEGAYKYVYDKKILPSMRSMQFAGKPIEINNSRIFNCSYLPIDDFRAFSEIMFLLLSGCGVGYSVQTHHVEKLPEIRKPLKSKRYLVGDSIEGWADAIRMLTKAYFGQTSTAPLFDFRDIRAKGASLITVGGKAPGPEPLKIALIHMQAILDRKKDGEKLTSLECHDIICHLADAVLSGGIRRAALISLFNLHDEEMLTCKFGNWWEQNPQRGRANNSAVLLRQMIDKETFLNLWRKIEASNSGEPGFIFTNDKDSGTNPSLRAGTKVLTTNGIFNIEDLQDKEFEVKNLNGKISKAKCWLSGKDKQLYELTLKGGHKYYATPEHEWPVWDGEKYIKIKTPNLKSKDLLPIIKENSLFNGILGTKEEGFTIGWCTGDGNLSTSNQGRKQIGFVFSKEDVELGISGKVINILNKVGETNINGHHHKAGTLEIQTTNSKITSWIESFGFKHKSEGISSKIWNECSEDFRQGFIDGLFSSDGYISNINNKESRIILNSAHIKLINEVSELLGFYGIKTSILHKLVEGNFPDKKYNIKGKLYHNYSLKITDKESLKHFNNLFTLSHSRKQNNLINIINNKIKNNKINKYSDKIEVINCKLVDIKEDVWDITVYDETHCFQIAHCITGNCAEINLKANQFCNLCEINASDIETQEEYNARAKAAAFIGTLQASYTDFHYLRDVWKKTTEKEALLGIGMTGIASGAVLKLNMKEAAKIACEENERVAKIIEINKAARVTTVKPSGTTSLVLGTSSGIHAWHDDFYMRRIRLGKNEALYTYLSIYHPEMLEDDFFKPTLQSIVSIPQRAPLNSITRSESAMDLLERIKTINKNWIKPGHRKGANMHNVSATVTIKQDEWFDVGEWLYENKEYFTALSFLPEDLGTYVQAPFSTITEEEFNEAIKSLHNIDLSKVIEMDDNTALMENLACSGNNCEIA